MREPAWEFLAAAWPHAGHGELGSLLAD